MGRSVVLVDRRELEGLRIVAVLSIAVCSFLLGCFCTFKSFSPQQTINSSAKASLSTEGSTENSNTWLD